MWREVETGNIIREGSSWISADGIKHPRNWHIWSEDEKKLAGLEEIIPDPIPNDITWWYTQNVDGTVTKKAKKLDDENATDTEAIEALFLVYDGENKGNKSGILYDWPELEK